MTAPWHSPDAMTTERLIQRLEGRAISRVAVWPSGEVCITLDDGLEIVAARARDPLPHVSSLHIYSGPVKLGMLGGAR